ncbi:MAG: histidine phosphatase family protein [Neisseriaceae bacterium]
MKQLKKYKLFILISLSSFLAYADRTLIFAIDIIRHGDRTPTTEIPKDPYSWQEGLGELTANGMKQEFNLGKNLRNKYVVQYKLLPAKYNNDFIYVRSSDYNRTLMSAQSVLLGLYPLGTGPIISTEQVSALPMGYQPIPIHTVPQANDSVLVPRQNKQKFNLLMKKYVFYSEAWQKKTIQYQSKIKRWNQITGISINDLKQVGPLGDNLYIRMLYGIPMPKGITIKDRDEIIKLKEWVVSHTFSPYNFGYYASKDLRETIAKYLINASNSTSKLKYVLFSAHDSILMSIMSALHKPLKNIPPYASDLNILLFKDNLDKQYYVQLKFNESEINLKGCQKFCNLSEFLKYLN